MNLEQIYFIAEILAAIAVVFSLLYLAIQVKHSRIQNKKEASNLITIQRAQFITLLATDSDLSRIVAKGLTGTSKLHANDYYRFTSYLYNIFVHLELGFRKWEGKDIDFKTWKAWHEASQWWFICPGVQSWWKHDFIKGFTPEFNAYVNNCMAKVNSIENPQLNKLISFLEEAGEKPKKYKKSKTKK